VPLQALQQRQGGRAAQGGLRGRVEKHRIGREQIEAIRPAAEHGQQRGRHARHRQRIHPQQPHRLRAAIRVQRAGGHVQHRAGQRHAGLRRHTLVQRVVELPLAGAQAQVGLHLGHGQLDRAVALDLQDQRAVELDIGLHQRGRGGHFAQQVGHRGRVAARLLAAAQDFLPAVGQAHQHAAHRQAFKQEFVEFRQSVLSIHQTLADRVQPIFFKPRRKRSALAR